MKIIPTFVHGFTDYLSAIVLLLAPNLFGFAELGGAAVWVPRVVGVLILLQSLATDYELGLMRVLPMRGHLVNDYVASLFLAISPWLFGFNTQPSNVWMPHLVAGLALFGIALLTQHVPTRVATDATSSTNTPPME